MAHTIYELDLNNLPSNVSITLNVGLEKTVEDLDREYEAPVRRRPSFLQRAALSALAMVLAAMPYVSGCGGPGPNPDTINPLPSSYNVSSNITPSDGTAVGPSDSPLEVGVDTPAIPAACSADPDCAAVAAGGMDVEFEVVSDNATPGNTSDDVVIGSDTHTGVPFDSYTSTTANLSGLPDGSVLEARVTLSIADADGVEHSVEGNVQYTFNDDTPVGPDILPDWTLDSANYNRYFSMTFHMSNTGTNMAYALKSISPTSSWFGAYFNLDSPRIRGPPTIDHGELGSDNPIMEWGNFEFVIEACDTDLGVCDEETIYGSIDRYVSTLVGQSGSRTCTVNITNAAADFIGAADGSYPGIPGYVETTHTDGSAVRISEVNNPSEVAEVSDRVESMPAQMISDVRRVSSTTAGAPESWDCIELLYTEGGEVMYRIEVEEP